MTRRVALANHLVLVGVLCGIIQIISATWLVTWHDTPNASLKIARNILQDGRYEGGYWALLRGPSVQPGRDEPRFFQLPGEALYLAFWFRILPEKMQRYVHVPVTVALVTSVTYVGALLGGPWLGLGTGILASVQPFVILHGPVWDDTFLTAALVWMVAGMLCGALGVCGGRTAPRREYSPWWFFALACGVIVASLTRMQAQVVFLVMAGTALAVPQLRRARVAATVMMLSVALAVVSWGVRNVAVTGEFTMSSSHDGIALLLSNGPHTRKAILCGQVDACAVAESLGEHWRRIAGLKEGEIDSYYRTQAIKYMKAHPVDVLITGAFKLGISLLGIRPEVSLVSLRNVGAIASSLVLYALATWGFYLLKLSLPKQVGSIVGWLFGVIGIVVIGMLIFGPIGIRYRLMLDSIMWIGGAAALVDWCKRRGCCLEEASRESVP